MTNFKRNGINTALYRIAEGQQGLFTARQAVMAGYDERNHPYYVKSGNWIKEYRGIYRLKNFPYSSDSQLSLWSLWSCNRRGEIQGVYSHETALQIHDLSDLSSFKLHITVPKNFRRSIKIPEILILHKVILEPSDWQTIAGYRVTTPTRTLFDMCGVDLSKRMITQIVREGLSRGLFPKQKLQHYKLVELVNRFR